MAVEEQVKEFESLSELLEDLDREGITGSQKREIVNTFLTLKAKTCKSPYNGGFELTPFCNFDCKMCYVHMQPNQIAANQRLLRTDEWISIMQQAIDAGMLNADLTGGECLTYPGFREIYLFLITNGIRVNILTNGFLLTHDTVDFLTRYRPQTVQISLYGSNPEGYLRVTGVDAFHQVMDNIKLLKSAGIPTQISITPHRYMMNDATEMIALARSLGLKYSISSVTLPARPETGRVMDDYIADAELFDQMLSSDMEYIQHQKQSANPMRPYHFTVKGLKKEVGLPCGSGRCGFHINWRGEMQPCIPLYDARHSVLTLGFSSAWELTQQSAASYREPEECKSCDLREYCKVCPAEKTFGKMQGTLNTAVCEKIKRKCITNLRNQPGGEHHEENLCSTQG